jgi:hypothetical protein
VRTQTLIATIQGLEVVERVAATVAKNFEPVATRVFNLAAELLEVVARLAEDGVQAHQFGLHAPEVLARVSAALVQPPCRTGYEHDVADAKSETHVDGDWGFWCIDEVGHAGTVNALRYKRSWSWTAVTCMPGVCSLIIVFVGLLMTFFFWVLMDNQIHYHGQPISMSLEADACIEYKS